MSFLWMTSSGQVNESQCCRKVKIVSVATAGMQSGMTMRPKIISSLAPSIRAASISSLGIVRMNWRIRKMPKAETMNGKIRAG